VVNKAGFVSASAQTSGQASPPGGDVTLSALQSTVGTLNFLPATTLYSITLPFEDNTAVLSASLNDTDGSLHFSTDSGATWSSFTSGNTTGSLSLAVGLNHFEFRVTAPNNATRIYTVNISRSPSTNPQIAVLSFSSGTLSPLFSSNTLSYAMTIANGASPLALTATAAEIGGTLEYSLDGSPFTTFTSGVAATGIALQVGANSLVVRSTAPDGVTTREYAFAIKRNASLNALLTAITPSSGSVVGFDSQTFAYSFAVGNTNSTITFTPTISAGARVTVNGFAATSGSPSLPVTLNVGSNQVTIVVEELQGGIAVNATTYLFTVNRDDVPAAITLASMPITTSGGALLTTSPTLTLKRDGLTLTRSANIVEVSISGSATLSGTTSISAVNGVATFSDLRVTGVAGNYTLTFSTTGGASVTSAQFALTPGDPVSMHLVFPGSTSTSLTCGGGSPCQVITSPVDPLPYPRFVLRDISGNDVPASGRTITAAITAGAGGLITAGANAVGTAGTEIVFDQLKVRGSGAVTYTLSFSSAGLTPATITLPATISSGDPDSLTLTTSASGAQSDSAFTIAPQVTIYDSELNVVSNFSDSVTATITNGADGALIGSATATPVNGVATFNTLGIRGVAGRSYTLSYSINRAGVGAVTQTITPTAGLATQLVLTRNAAGFVNSAQFTTQPQLEIRDSAGNVITSDSTRVVTLSANNDGRISGFTARTAVSGIVTFTDSGLVAVPNLPITLTFGSPGLTSATQLVTLNEGGALNPTFSAITKTEDGFEVDITNFSPLYAWSIAGTNNASASISKSGKITVTNLLPGATTTLTVGTQRPYYASGTGTISGSPLSAGVEAMLTLGAASANGFAITVSNHLALTSFSWEITASKGAVSAAPNGSGVITVSGLNPGESSVVSVRTYIANSNSLAISEITGIASGSGASSAATQDLTAYGANLLTGKTLTPICTAGALGSDQVGGVNDGASTSNFTCYTSTSRKAVGYVRNSIGFVAAGMESSILEGIRFIRGTGSPANIPLTYTLQGCLAANSGCTPIITNGQTQLAAVIGATGNAASRAGAVQVVRASRPYPFYRMTFTSLTASVTNAVQIGEVIFLGRSVINPAYAPTFGATTKSRNGYTVQISNYDTSFMWRAVAPTGMTATVSTTGLVKVSGVAPGASATVTVETSRIGFTAGSAAFTGAALNSALVPIFDAPVTSTNGFSIAITNYDPAFTWNVVASAGNTSLSGGVVTVTNVPTATSASVTVTTTKTDYASGTAQISATSTQTGVTPTLAATTPTTSGFTTSISNFVAGYTYQVATDAGTATLGNLGAITVTGLNPGAGATVTVTASRSGYSTTSTTISGVAALGEAYIPVIGAALSNATGFTAKILNFDPLYSWSATLENAGPTVSILNDEITVTGLALGVSSTIIVTATRIGYAPGTTQFSGVAIAPAVGTLGAQDLSFIVELSTATSTVAPQARIDIPALAASKSTQFTVRANSSEVADAGFGSVQIQANGAGAAVTAMNVPIAILLPSVAANGIPSFSADGITWMRIPQLQSLELPAGQEMGYFTNDDGSITILTRRIG
jgi:hypothetical protein